MQPQHRLLAEGLSHGGVDAGEEPGLVDGVVDGEDAPIGEEASGVAQRLVRVHGVLEAQVGRAAQESLGVEGPEDHHVEALAARVEEVARVVHNRPDPRVSVGTGAVLAPAQVEDHGVDLDRHHLRGPV